MPPSYFIISVCSDGHCYVNKRHSYDSAAKFANLVKSNYLFPDFDIVACFILQLRDGLFANLELCWARCFWDE